jgi:uncharacterized membrane protein (DUF373 family)
MKNISERTKAPATEIQKYWSVMTLYERFEHIVVIILSAIISIVILFALLQLIREVYTLLVSEVLITPLNHGVFQVVFGMIMTLLIAMEFKHSILKVLQRQAHIIQARGVIIIAMLALSRKLIILDFSTVKPEKLAALGFVILVLAIVYYLLKRSEQLQTT